MGNVLGRCDPYCNAVAEIAKRITGLIDRPDEEAREGRGCPERLLLRCGNGRASVLRLRRIRCCVLYVNAYTRFRNPDHRRQECGDGLRLEQGTTREGSNDSCAIAKKISRARELSLAFIGFGEMRPDRSASRLGLRL
jgi:hypothetical protein